MMAAVIVGWVVVSGIFVVGTHWLVERGLPRGESWLNARQLRGVVSERGQVLDLVAAELRRLDTGAHAVIVPRDRLRALATMCEKKGDDGHEDAG